MSLSAYVKEEDAKNMRNLKLFLDRAILLNSFLKIYLLKPL